MKVPVTRAGDSSRSLDWGTIRSCPFLDQFPHERLLPGDPLLTLQDMAPFHSHCIFGRPAAHLAPLTPPRLPVVMHRYAGLPRSLPIYAENRVIPIAPVADCHHNRTHLIRFDERLPHRDERRPELLVNCELRWHRMHDLRGSPLARRPNDPGEPADHCDRSIASRAPVQAERAASLWFALDSLPQAGTPPHLDCRAAPGDHFRPRARMRHDL